jgi:hypothetical protein
LFEYRRGFARLLDLPFGRQEVTINIGSAAALYKSLITASEGYAGDVPIIHQAVAVKAAIDAMGTAFKEDSDAKFSAGEWPDDPSFQFLVRWAARGEERCDPGLCLDAPEDDAQAMGGEGTAYPLSSRPDGCAQTGRSS